MTDRSEIAPVDNDAKHEPNPSPGISHEFGCDFNPCRCAEVRPPTMVVVPGFMHPDTALAILYKAEEALGLRSELRDLLRRLKEVQLRLGEIGVEFNQLLGDGDA